MNRERRENRASRPMRALSCIMAIVLAIGCCSPMPAFAREGEGSAALGAGGASLAAGSAAGGVADAGGGAGVGGLAVQGSQDTFDLSADPIVLSTRADLEAFRNAVNDYAGYALSGKTVKLANDIDLAGSEGDQWTPIGFVSGFKSGRAYYAWGFDGTFDGQGHTISGLYINSSEGGQALFGFLNAGATLENLVVKGTVTSGGSCVAGVVASAALESRAETRIRNVGSEVNVTSTATGDNVYVGGVLAYAEYKTAVLSGCYNKGALAANRSVSYVGGISGWRGTVSDCYNLGDITVNNSNSSTCAGGVIGSFDKMNGSVERSYSNASVNLTGTPSAYCGGIAGSGSTFQDCFYNAEKASKGVGGYLDVTGVSAYPDAPALLDGLSGAEGAGSAWADGSAVNLLHGGTAALSWEARDVVTYSVSKAPCQHGSFSTGYDVCVPGARVLVAARPDAGYVAGDIAVVDERGASVDVANGSFVMPAANVTVSVSFRQAPQVYYNVTKAASENGSFTVSCESALVNTQVRVVPVPAEGYELDGITVTGSTGADVPVADGAFFMPAGDVWVSVTFKACRYLDARVVVKPVAGGAVPEDMACVLQDQASGAQVQPVNEAGSGANTIYLFKAVNGHRYDVKVVSDVYELAAPATLEADEMRSASPSVTVQLAYKRVSYEVSFDPGQGAFPPGADVQLASGRATVMAANGSLIAPPDDPQRDGYAFAGWFAGETRFLACMPVTGNASYVAKWERQADASGDTFLLDAGSSSHDGSYARPYRISTERDLRDFARVVNGAEPADGLWRDIEGWQPTPLSGKYVSLQADIAMSGAAVPVGIGSAASGGAYRARPFSGTFLGNNHVIDAFTVDEQSNPAFGGDTLATGTLVTKHVAHSYSALFGAVAGATIQDVTVKLAGGSLDAAAAAAGLVALAGDGSTRIGHCAVQGGVSQSDDEGGVRAAGGLVAVYAPTANGTLKVDHCYQVGDVSSTALAGGIVGSVSAAGAELSASYHVGRVVSTSKTDRGSAGAFIGGAGGDNAVSSVIGCVTEQGIDPVGATAASQAVVTGCLTGLAVSQWADGVGDGEARTLLGDEYFDFAAPLPCGSPSLREVLWASGHQVTFVAGRHDVSGGVPSMAPQDEGAVFAIPPCTLKRAGYELAGWKLLGSSDGKTYATGDSLTMPDEDVTLVAQWALVSKSALFEALAQAMSARNSVAHVAQDAADVTQGESFVTADEMAALEAAMEAAQAVRADRNAAQAVVDAATASLSSAVEEFKAAVKRGAKADGAPQPDGTISPHAPSPAPAGGAAETGSGSEGAAVGGSATERELVEGAVVHAVVAGKGATFDVKVSARGCVTLTKATVKPGASVTVNTVTIEGATFKVTAIAAGAFKGTKAKKVTIGNNVTSIGKGAFAGAGKLKAATVGKNVRSIGKGAFKGAKALKKLTCKSSKLGKSAFKNMVKGSKVKTVKLSGVSKKAKRNYKKWAKPLGVIVK